MFLANPPLVFCNSLNHLLASGRDIILMGKQYKHQQILVMDLMSSVVLSEMVCSEMVCHISKLSIPH